MSKQLPQVTYDLMRAKAFIDSPEKWCQGAYFSPNGAAACSLGALTTLDDANPAYFYLQRTMDGFIGSFNDCHTHAEVMAAWDKAIELSIKEPNLEEGWHK